MARSRALDFGCGVGRLTQALCEDFDECHGVDIAASMIRRARELNRHGDRCKYHVNDAADLALFEDGHFDMVLSIIVLQHIEPAYSTRYIAEFVRVLRPGGVAIFQLPEAHHRAPPAALPAGAFRATVTVSEAPGRLVAGSRADLDLTIRNDSRLAWPRLSRVTAGDRWRRDGELVVHDDGRTPVAQEVPPEGEVRLRLAVTAPAAPGRYELELDLVEEGVAWFADRGSTVTRLAVDVTAAPRSARSLLRPLRALARRVRRSARKVRPEQPPPEMDMFCVTRDEVRAVVAAAGGEIADISRFDACGEDFESYRYVVRRP